MWKAMKTISLSQFCDVIVAFQLLTELSKLFGPAQLGSDRPRQRDRARKTFFMEWISLDVRREALPPGYSREY
jgi:hypothetical protein